MPKLRLLVTGWRPSWVGNWEDRGEGVPTGSEQPQVLREVLLLLVGLLTLSVLQALPFGQLQLIRLPDLPVTAHPAGDWNKTRRDSQSSSWTGLHAQMTVPLTKRRQQDI